MAEVLTATSSLPVGSVSGANAALCIPYSGTPDTVGNEPGGSIDGEIEGKHASEDFVAAEVR